MNSQPKKLVKSSSATELTPEQIYDIVLGKDKGGIQGYKCPRHYYDYHAVLWLRKREEILKQIETNINSEKLRKLPRSNLIT